MKTLYLTIACAFLWSSSLSAQTIKDAFPELESASPELRSTPLSSRFFKYTPASFPVGLRWPEWLKPTAKEWILSLEPEDSPDPTNGYIEVVTRSEKEFFVIFRSPQRKHTPIGSSSFGQFARGGGRVFRITPNRIDMVTTVNHDDNLFPTQIGVSRWTYDYFETGHIKEQSAWRGSPMSDHWSRVSTTTYSYWPNSGKIQTITEDDRSFGGRHTITKHFDQDGNRVPPPPPLNGPS